MIERTDGSKNNHSDRLIETIREASKDMNFDDYAYATGLEKEYILRILKGDVEQVDDATLKKLSLLQ
jgi:hypothetical protein